MISDQNGEGSLKCKPAWLHPLVFTVSWESLQAVCNLHQFSYFYVSQIEPSAAGCRLQDLTAGAGPDISTGCAADTQSRDRGLVTTGSQSYHANISFLGNSVFNPIMNDAWLEASDEGVLPSFVWWLVSDNTGCLLLSPGRVHVSLCGPARVICIHQRVNWLRHSWHRDADRERRF